MGRFFVGYYSMELCVFIVEFVFLRVVVVVLLRDKVGLVGLFFVWFF